MTTYERTKTVVHLDQLQAFIKASSLGEVLVGVRNTGNTVYADFSEDLSEENQGLLTDLVATFTEADPTPIVEMAPSSYVFVSFNEFLALVRARITEVFARNISATQIELRARIRDGISITTVVGNPSAEWSIVAPVANKPAVVYDRRIISHDFADPSTWPLVNGNPSAHFSVTPVAGWKYFLTSCLVRFPANTTISPTNAFHFRVSLSTDGVSAPVPVITYNYMSLADLIQKSNVPMHTLETVVPDAYSGPMVELEFRYADPNTLDGAPIIFRSSLAEKLELYFDDDSIPFKDANGAALTDSCYIVLNFRRTVEF